MDPLRSLRIAAVPYLNAAPLVHCLKGVRTAVPSQLAKWLDEGECDLATMPIGAVLDHPEWRVLPRLGIAADGPVRTVLLLHSQPLDRIRQFRPDPASRSSNLLARIVLKEFTGTDPEPFVHAEARVVIGDAAFGYDPARDGTDLGQAWKDLSGLPMVFAAWIASKNLAKDELRLKDVEQALVEAWRQGTGLMTEIVESQKIVPGPVALDYLCDNIVFPLDDRFRAGADLFAQKAFELGVGTGMIPWL